MTKIKGIVEKWGDTKHNIMLDDKVYKPTEQAFEFVKKYMVGKRVEITLTNEGSNEFSFIRITSDQEGTSEQQPMIRTKEEVKEQMAETKKQQQKEFDIKPYIINLQGKDYITHEGLLKLAHHKGLANITSKIIEVNVEKGVCIVQARVMMENGKMFSGLGDATPQNLNAMIKPHFIRMAETRAINRALRFATGLGMCSFDELGGGSDGN